MPETFVSAVRKGLVKSPSQKGFDPEKWIKASKNFEVDADSVALLNAGPLVFERLQMIRDELDKLIDRNPGLRHSDLIQLYCGVSNRDRFILSGLIEDKFDSLEKGETYASNSMHSLKTAQNSFGIELPLYDIAIGCVDGYQFALLRNIKTAPSEGPRAKKTKEGIEDEKEDDKKLTGIDFIQFESRLSQLYAMYEEYWQGILWGALELKEVEEKNLIYILQKDNERELAKFVSYIRKERLSSESAMFSADPSFLKLLSDQMAIFEYGSGKAKSYKARPMAKLSEMQQFKNVVFESVRGSLLELFPKEFIFGPLPNHGFCVNDVLHVFKQICLLSHQMMDKFPENDGVVVASKCKTFSPSINRARLAQAISSATNLKIKVVDDIISFLTYDGSRAKDLWRNPLLSDGDRKVRPLMAPLIDANIIRCVEGWLAQSEVNLSDKGLNFEKIALSQVQSALSKSEIIKDFDTTEVANYTASGITENIDLIFRAGNLVVVSEVKCIVTTDSNISYSRTLDILEKASGQATRKAKFVEDNLSAVFARAGWDFDSSVNYRVEPIVINSNQMCSGFPIFEVPITDTRLLKSYFSSGTIPLFSEQVGGKINHRIRIRLYASEQEAVDNFVKYLNSPPQIQTITQNVGRHDVPIVGKDGDKLSFVFQKYDHKNPGSYRKIAEHDYGFKVEIDEDFQIEKLDDVKSV
jgi:hypothetical protein